MCPEKSLRFFWLILHELRPIKVCNFWDLLQFLFYWAFYSKVSLRKSTVLSVGRKVWYLNRLDDTGDFLLPLVLVKSGSDWPLWNKQGNINSYHVTEYTFHPTPVLVGTSPFSEFEGNIPKSYVFFDNKFSFQKKKFHDKQPPSYP